MPEPDESDRRAVDNAVAAIRSALGKGRELGALSLARVGSGTDDAVAALVRDRVRRALGTSTSPRSRAALVAALRGDASSLARRVGAGGMARLARRAGPARAVAGRSPAALALRFGPALYEVVNRSRSDIDVVAGELVAIARAAGVEPAPSRVEVAVVQALTGEPVDPGASADVRALARAWLGGAGGGLVPFGLGSRGGRRVDDVADAVLSVDPVTLGEAGPGRRSTGRA